MIRRVIAILLFIVALGGCATVTSVPDIPSTLGENQGLLVARLYVPGTHAWENAKVYIDGRMYGSNVRDGYIGITLEAGEHNLSNLRIEGWQTSSYAPEETALRKVRGGGGYSVPIYVPYYTTIYYTSLSVNRKFTVEAGKVTNLGLIVYLPDESAPKKPGTAGQNQLYRTVTLDNRAEMNTYLARNYPALVASLKNKSVQNSPGKYLDTAHLPDLRRLIAITEAKSGRSIANNQLTAVYGDAGTLVTVKRAAFGERPIVEVLETGTLADIVSARRDGERLLFLTSEGKLLSVMNGKMTAAGKPLPIHAVQLGIFGDGSLAVVDNHLRLFTSRDLGATWTSQESAMVVTPRNDIGIAGDGRDLYVYLGRRGTPERILHVRADDPAIRSIAPPSPSALSAARSTWLIAREAGLFLVSAGREFYFQPHTGGEWKLQFLPAEKCKPMAFDYSGAELRVECDAVKYESRDSGATWAKLAV